MRRLIFLLILLLPVVLYFVRKRQKVHRAQELLIEDLVRSFERDYRKDRGPSGDWLKRLRDIRERYGDEIARAVAKQLKEDITRQ